MRTHCLRSGNERQRVAEQLAIAANCNERLPATHSATHGWGSVEITVACLRGSDGGIAPTDEFDHVTSEYLRDLGIRAPVGDWQAGRRVTGREIWQEVASGQGERRPEIDRLDSFLHNETPLLAGGSPRRTARLSRCDGGGPSADDGQHIAADCSNRGI